MNILTIAGTIGRDAEVRTTQGGDKVAGFSVAVNEGKDKTVWYDCSLWGKRADSLSPYLTKGSRVAVSGRPGAREHNGKIYMQCNVDQISLLGGGQKSQGQQSGGYDQSPEGYSADRGDLSDDIPF